MFNINKHSEINKKSGFKCAWCNSLKTTIVQNNPYKHEIPFSITQKINNHFYNIDDFIKKQINQNINDTNNIIPRYNFLISCNICKKNSNVKNVFCKYCNIQNTTVSKITFSVAFNNLSTNYVCNSCSVKNKSVNCEHVWDELFCEELPHITILNLKCIKCNILKKHYSNYRKDPVKREEYDFYF